jgi:hypothetical protein
MFYIVFYNWIITKGIENMKKEYKENWKELEKAYFNLSRMFESIGNGYYGIEYFNICKFESKQWIKCKPSGIKHNLTLKQDIQYFYVKWIIEIILNKRHIVTIKDVLTTRKSFIQASTLYINFKEEIEKALIDIDFNKIIALDYAELVKE